MEETVISVSDFHENKKITKILITGIACVGKTTLQKKIHLVNPSIVTVDLDNQQTFSVFEQTKTIILVGHFNIRKQPQEFNKVLFISPHPVKHVLFWCRRIIHLIGKIRFKKDRKRLLNLRHIIVNAEKILKCIYHITKVKGVIDYINREIPTKVIVVQSVDQGLEVINKWLSNTDETNGLSIVE